ncbi:hypothetical protein ACJJTC_016490 [Scirpophaga incertulas]
MEKQKRERSSNFSQEETNLLVSLIEAKKHVIENKKSDATTWQEKEKAWKDIEKTFNSASGAVFRDYKHLKIKYEAMKRDTRKRSAIIRAERFKTGGGTNTAPSLTTEQEKLKSMILFSVEGSESQFDSDLVLPSKPKEKRPFDKLTEKKLEIAKIQKKVITEELEHKLIQRKILEKELEHKDMIHELEKQYLILKIKLLKKELGET